MGMLHNGIWTNDDGGSRGVDGGFDHLPTSFRDQILGDDLSLFQPGNSRYFLYVTKTCPWAHRTLIYRFLKDLEGVIGVIFCTSGTEGYILNSSGLHTPPGTNYKITYLHELYTIARPNYTGRVTVPVLWDAKENTIINNESSEIIRMLNSEFSAFTSNDYDYYPERKKAEIDNWNKLIYDNINNGVYKAGFSSRQSVYEKAFNNLFNTLDLLEKCLSTRRFLCGQNITEADWRLFPTLFRFDSIYHYAFKCNKKHLYEYPHLWGYTRDLYQQPGVSNWCFLEEAKIGYWSSPNINPLGTVPKGPDINFYQKHTRDKLV